MSKALDPRVVDKAKAVSLMVTFNQNVAALPVGTFVPPPSYAQVVNIIYDLLDAQGRVIAHANRSHVTTPTAAPLTVRQATVAVKDAVGAWLTTDRLELANNDTDAQGAPVG